MTSKNQERNFWGFFRISDGLWWVKNKISVNWARKWFSFFIICVKREIREWKFTPILSEYLVSFSVIYCEMAEITWIGCNQEFTIQKWSEMRLRQMLKIAFDPKFSVTVNSLTHHYDEYL